MIRLRPMPTLSLCMLAKGSETDRLAKSLASVAGLIDRADVLVDDRHGTAALDAIAQFPFAVAHRDEIPLFVSPEEAGNDLGWIDFGAARNLSISKVPEDVDWIMVVDADEDITEIGNLPLVLREMDGREECGAVSIRVDSVGLDGVPEVNDHPRLFRRGRIRYRWPVHNEPKWEGTVGTSVAVVHSDYREGGADRTARALAQLRKMHAMVTAWPMDHPDRKAGLVHSTFHLAKTHATIPDMAGVEKWARACIEAIGDDPRPIAPRTWRLLTLAVMELRGVDAAMEVYLEGVKRFRRYPDLLHCLITIATYDWASSLFETADREKDPHRFAMQTTRHFLGGLEEGVRALGLSLRVTKKGGGK